MPLLRPRVQRRDKPTRGTILAGTDVNEPLLTAIVKWIPVEVLTVYKTVDGILKDDRFRLGFAGFVIVITPLWIAFATRPRGKRIAWRQVVLSPFAFMCWAMALMQPETTKLLTASWEPWMGSLALGVGTLLLPVFDGILRSLGVPQDE
jgi:hypothetical protein